MNNEPQSRVETGDRDGATGRFTRGNRANPGGRPALPDWFKAHAEDSLRLLVEVMKGEREDPKISAAQAAIEIIDRVYGKPKQAHEVTGARGLLVELLSRPAPPIPEVE